MTDHQKITVTAPMFKEWYEQLEEVVTHDPAETAPGNLRSAVLLLHDLIDIGLRVGAVRPLVTRSTGPHGFAHLTYRYPLSPEFDWGGGIEFARGANDFTPAQLIAEIEVATGITVEEDRTSRNEQRRIAR